jgi:hypothetical protein
MGRKGKYETHVEPRLHEVSKWICTMTEGQIASKLGINQSTFQRYKNKHPELAEALVEGIGNLKVELKETLKKKAQGYTYKEVKTTKKIEGGKVIAVTQETYERYAQPDTGAIHLLLKNIDEEWRNDDKTSVDLKKRQLDLTEKRVEQGEW